MSLTIKSFMMIFQCLSSFFFSTTNRRFTIMVPPISPANDATHRISQNHWSGCHKCRLLFVMTWPMVQWRCQRRDDNLDLWNGLVSKGWLPVGICECTNIHQKSRLFAIPYTNVFSPSFLARGLYLWYLYLTAIIANDNLNTSDYFSWYYGS